MTTTFIPTLGIRLGADLNYKFMSPEKASRFDLDMIVDRAGPCPSCEDFWHYGGFEDYCVDCV